MEQDNTTTTVGAPAPEFVRPLEGRMIAGVAKGLSDRFDIPDWVIRVAFVATLFAGGLGLILYLAIWALVRSEDEQEPPASRFFDGARSTQSWIGIGLIFLAVLFLLDNLTFLSRGVIWAGALIVVGVLLYAGQIPLPKPRTEGGEGESPPPGGQAPNQATASMATASVASTAAATEADSGDSQGHSLTPPPPPLEPRPARHPRPARPPKERSILGRLTLGTAILAMGVLAALDTLPGVPIEPQARHYVAVATTVIGLGLLIGSMWGRARWLLLIGAVLVPTLFVSPLAEAGWRATGTYISPTSFESVQPIYRFEVATIHLDLTGLPWDSETVDVEVTGDVGRIRVFVPHDVTVSGRASVEVGSINVPGQGYGWGFGRRVADFTSDHFEGEDVAYPNMGHVQIRTSVDVGTIQVMRVWVDRSSE